MRRIHLMRRAGNKFLFLLLMAVAAASAHAAVELGIDVLAAKDYDLLRGKRVGLITNQTGVDAAGTRTRVLLRKNVNLVALYTPEHGLDGREKAGRYVASRRDPVTGLIAHSLYGPTRKPTSAMLHGIDALVFDLQDIGCRSYTYISTMGKCMEAAAENGVEFVILDRPNPLGGLRVEGPLVEPRWTSFVSQYPVPYVHGMTCGELARMINDKGWINGRCKLEVVTMRGWHRSDMWRDTGLRWVPTSPNIPRSTSPAYYVATGLVSELAGPETGIDGPRPFELIGARGINPAAFTRYLEEQNIRNVSFTPWRSGAIGGSALQIEPASAGNLTAINVYTLAEFNRQLRTNLISRSGTGKREMFFKCYGSASIAAEIARGRDPDTIVAGWSDDVRQFQNARSRYLLY